MAFGLHHAIGGNGIRAQRDDFGFERQFLAQLHHNLHPDDAAHAVNDGDSHDSQRVASFCRTT